MTNELSTDSDGLRDYKKVLRERAQKRAETGARLTATLIGAGVAHVVAEYDGCGDSGQIDTIEFLDAARQPCAALPDGVEREVEDFLYDLLEARHGGWENNDGACGTFTWDLAQDALDHEHKARFTDFDTSSFRGFGGWTSGDAP